MKPTARATIPGPHRTRVARVDAVLRATYKDLTHERIALNIGMSPIALLCLCERRGIDVRRAPGPRPRCLVPTGGEKEEARGRAVSGRRCPSEERAESLRVGREEFGGYYPERTILGMRMGWRPGKRKACPAFTTASLYTPGGEAIEYHPPPLASLGEIEPEHKPVTPGEKRKTRPANHPSGSWAQPSAATLHRVGSELSEELRRVHRVSKYAKPTGGPKRRAEVRA